MGVMVESAFGSARFSVPTQEDFDRLENEVEELRSQVEKLKEFMSGFGSQDV